MITSNDSSKSSSIKQSYTELFRKYNDKAAAIGIPDNEWFEVQDLADYYGNLGTIAKYFLVNDSSSQYKDYYEPSFIRLPLDEQPFVINADTRTITVPSQFKNGISVEGDHGCEILYFKINRYFDGIDFNDKQIRIQCENADGDQYLYREIFRDVKSEPGYIIFGWAIDNKVTEKAGNIKFSVRIFDSHIDNNTNQTVIDYSFTTLTQTAVINPSMNYDFSNVYINSPDSSWILGQIKNSSYVDEQGALKPFLLYMNGLSDISLNEFEINIPQGSASKNIILEAGSLDNGVISYLWETVSSAQEQFININGTDSYEKTTDEQVVNGRKYFKKVSGNFIEDYLVNEAKLAQSRSADDDSENIIYIRRNSNPISKAGEYKCKIVNHLKGDGVQYIDFKVPGPTLGGSIVYSEQMPGVDNIIHIIVPDADSSVVLKAGAQLGDAVNDVASYSWIRTSDGVLQTSNTDGSLTVNVDNNNFDKKYKASIYENRNNSNYKIGDTYEYRVTKAPQKLSIKISSPATEAERRFNKSNTVNCTAQITSSQSIPSDKITYKWYRINDTQPGIADDILVYEKDNDVTFPYTPSIGAGSYYCVAINHLNGQSVVSEPSSEIINVTD